METRIPLAAENARAFEKRFGSASAAEHPGSRELMRSAACNIVEQWYSGERRDEAVRDLRTVADCIRSLFPDRLHSRLQELSESDLWTVSSLASATIADFAAHKDTTFEDVRVVYEKAEQMVAEVVA